MVCALCPRAPTIGACWTCGRRCCIGCLEVDVSDQCWSCLGYSGPQANTKRDEGTTSGRHRDGREESFTKDTLEALCGLYTACRRHGLEERYKEFLRGIFEDVGYEAVSGKDSTNASQSISDQPQTGADKKLPRGSVAQSLSASSSQGHLPSSVSDSTSQPPALHAGMRPSVILTPFKRVRPEGQCTEEVWG